MKKLLLASACFLSAFTISYAQPALAWAQRYNGPPDNADEAVSIAVDAAGNSYVTGSAFASNGTLDMVTIKYSPAGQQMWLQSYNGTANDNDQASQLVIDNAGNVYVTGYSKGTSSLQDITTIKYNNAGVQQWVSLYNGAFNNSDQGNALTVDASGNVYVTGYETDTNYTSNFVTLKYNSAGVQQWVQIYDGPGHFIDESRDIALDGNGDIYVTGPSDTFYNSQPNADIVLLKYSNAGAFQWRRVYDSPGHGYEYSKKLAIDRNNNITVVGYGFITGNGNDYLLLQYNSSGAFQWYRNYNFAANTFEQPAGIVTDSLNNIIVTGQGITPASGNTNDYVTVKYDAGGTFLWAARYNNLPSGEDRGAAVCLDDSMNIYVTGFSKGTNTNFDIATVKYDPAGNQQYVVRFDNASASRDDAGNAIAVKNGDIYVTGKSANGLNDDYVTLRYSYSAIGINEPGNLQTTLTAFPNPSNGQLSIILPKGASFANQSIHAEIINSVGQTISVSTVIPTESNNGESIISVNTSGLASGMFLLKIYTDNATIGATRIMVQ